MKISFEKYYTPAVAYSKRLLTGVTSKRVAFIAIAIGIGLRLIHYLLDRSLWIDEAFVALNIQERSLLELLDPLKYNQAAPVGFLAITKSIALLGGENEYLLRLFPFISAIVALLLFYRVAKWFGSLLVLAISLSLFALCDRAIYYSAELKQYSSDIMFALAIYCLAIALQKERLNFTVLASAAILGGIFIWFSHPAVFVLAGTGSTLLVSACWRKDLVKVKQYLAVFGVWLLSFIAFYQISLTRLINNDALQSSWGGAHDSFMPFPPTSLPEAKWFVDKFFEIFNYPVGIYLTGIAAFAFIVGCAVLFQERKDKLFILLSPIVVTALASGLHKYPFKGQLLLFIIPAMLLIIAEGTSNIIEATRPKFKFLGIAFAVLLFFYPVYYAVLNLNNPYKYPAFEYQRVREDIKPVLNYVEQNYQAEDVVYVYYAAQYALKYYLDRYDFIDTSTEPRLAPTPQNWFEPVLPSYPPQLIVGQYSREDWQIFLNELRQLKGNNRVWLIFAHAVDRRSPLDEEDAFLEIANTLGVQHDRYQGVEAAAYLYDFS